MDDSPNITNIIEVLKPKPPTAKEVAWNLLSAFVGFIILAVVASYIGQLAWNNLTTLTGLPDISFLQAVNAYLVVRMIGAAFQGVNRK